MPDEELKNKSDDNELSEEERIKREIAEYEALLEDELKPITLSFEEPEQEIKEQEALLKKSCLCIIF